MLLASLQPADMGQIANIGNLPGPAQPEGTVGPADENPSIMAI